MAALDAASARNAADRIIFAEAVTSMATESSCSAFDVQPELSESVN